IWSEDADKLDFDRWNRISQTKAGSPYAFAAFNGGPRVCIKKRFAMLLFKVVLVEMGKRFEFEMVREMNITVGAEIRR
ncbi:uncharacterized protein BCR38DRAFT_333255, partial [Pseudomassariella vexata]